MIFGFIRKHFLILFLILQVIPARGQESGLPSDSLSKYSYTIFGILGNSSVLDMGTCCFYKRNSSLFLITAKHVLYHCDTLSNREVPKFESASIFLPTNFELLQFRVPYSNASCIIYYKDSDLFVVKVDSNWISKVNTIGQFIIPVLLNYEKLTIFGQGMKSDSLYTGFEKQHNIELKPKSFTFYKNAPVPDSNYVDTIHNFVETKEITIGRWMKGFSGSPVFLQDKKSKKWRFCGVFVQALYKLSDELPGGLVVVTPDFILQAIESIVAPMKSP